MLFLKYVIIGIQLLLGTTPVGVALLAIQLRSWQLALASLAAVFAVVAILPLFRKRESIWVFFFVFLTSTPLNLTGIIELLNSFLFEDSFLLTNILRGALMYLIALSIEELICGMITRFIWKKQYKTVMIQV